MSGITSWAVVDNAGATRKPALLPDAAPLTGPSTFVLLCSWLTPSWPSAQCPPVYGAWDGKVCVQEEGLRVSATARELAHRAQPREGHVALMGAAGEAVALQLAACMLQVAQHQRIPLHPHASKRNMGHLTE